MHRGSAQSSRKAAPHRGGWFLSLSGSAAHGPALQRIDLLIGIALAVAVLGSAVGVATYDDARLGRFLGTWTTSQQEVSVEPTAGGAADTVEMAFDVAARNITEALVTVGVQGNAVRAAPVAILVEVVVPGMNETFSQEGELPAGPGAAAEVPVAIPIRAIPPALEGPIEASSPASAAGIADDVYGSDVGVGNWTIRVTLSPTTPGPLGQESFSVGATAVLTVYALELAPETPEVEAR